MMFQKLKYINFHLSSPPRKTFQRVLIMISYHGEISLMQSADSLTVLGWAWLEMMAETESTELADCLTVAELSPSSKQSSDMLTFLTSSITDLALII